MLENSKEHIDDLFADYLVDYEEKVPEFVWHNIQADLKQKRLQKRYSIVRRMAAAASLLITFGLGYFYADFTQYKQYEGRYLNIEPETIIQPKSTKVIENGKVSASGPKTKVSPASKNNSNSELAKSNENLSNYMIFKLFDVQKLFSNESSEARATEKFKSRNSKEKASNQLLIDTLLFKKEDLSERGFLLNEKKQNRSRWSFGTKFSPVYSLAENVKQPGGQSNEPVLKSQRNSDIPNTKADEKSMLSFSGGVNFNYHLSRRWSIESGVFYSQHRQMAENLVGSTANAYSDELTVYTPEGTRFVEADNIPETNPSTVIGSSQEETYYSLDMDYVTNYEYIELPLIVRYKIIDQRFGLDILSGLSTNFLVGNKSSIMYNKNDIWTGAAEGISPILYNATIGLGFNYNIYDNLSFNFEPTFKYSMTPDESSTLIKYPYSFAVFAGFSLRF